MTSYAQPVPPRRSMDVRRARKTGLLRRLPYVVLGLAALAGAVLALTRLGTAAPTVERAALWIGKVQRGAMVRDVNGPGKLVPVDIRWITSMVNARVERVVHEPGDDVKADTVLIELSNKDVELAQLEAERQLSQAEAELINLQASLSAERLGQQSLVASLTSELGDARRRARADEVLASKGFLSELEQAATQDKSAELGGRLVFEQKRLAALSDGIRAQVAAQTAQVERLRSIAEFRRKEVDGLGVRAGLDGVVQELTLAPGQVVAAGTLLAKVARPDRLDAEIRIPETQAKDVAIGQRASIDTRNGIIPGEVARLDPAVQSGTVRVTVALRGALPPGARPDLNVEGVIELERLDDALFMDRPLQGEPNSTVSLFKLVDAENALRVDVRLGRGAARTVEVTGGLNEGELVVLSDMSQWAKVDRLRIR